MNGGDYIFLQRANKTFMECIQSVVQQTGLSAPLKSQLYAGGSLEEREPHGVPLLRWNCACIYCMIFSCHVCLYEHYHAFFQGT